MDLGLRQRDLAKRWGLRSETVGAWERGRVRPSVRLWPRIIELLGFDPAGAGDSQVARLEAARRRLGLTRRAFAARVGLDEGSICHWWRGDWAPSPSMAARIEALLRELEPGHGGAVASAPSYFDLTRWRRTPPTGAPQPKTTGDLLRQRRLELGLSQAEAGRLFGVGRVTVYRWEREKSQPPASCRDALARFLGAAPAPVSPRKGGGS